MPESLKIIVKNKVYTTPILNEEMNNIARQIETTKDDILNLNNRLNESLSNYSTLQNRLLAIYIHTTGYFPGERIRDEDDGDIRED